MTWLTSPSPWNYRKLKYITNTLVTTLSNYQMKFTLHQGSGTDTTTDIFLDGNANSDLSDVRFTDTDGTTLLNYWFETNSGGVATVWIKVPSISPSGNPPSYIYIYYGNSSQTSNLSNGGNTFVLYKGLQTTSYVSPTLPITSAGYVYTNLISIAHSQSQGDNVGFGFGDSTNRFPSNSILVELYGGWTSKWYLWRSYAGGTNTNIKDTTTPSYSYGATYKYKYEIIFASSSSAKLYRDGAQIGTTMTSGLPTSPMGIFMNIGDTTGYQVSDYQFIRKYVYPEPAWQVANTQETYTIQLTVSSSPSGAEIYLNGGDTFKTTTDFFALYPGTYDITLKKTEYQDWWSGYFTIDPNDPSQQQFGYVVTGDLLPSTGNVSITSTPSVANVLIAPHLGTLTYQGTTPITISNLDIGIYDYKLTKSGYYDETGTFSISSDATTSLDVPLTLVIGAITLNSTPSNAEIWLAPTGSPLVYQGIITTATVGGLTPGISYTYELRLTDYYPKDATFALVNGETIIRSETLDPLPCPVSLRYSGNTITLQATPRDGVGPYYVEFRKEGLTIDLSRLDGPNPISNAPENTTITRHYILDDADIAAASMGTIDFGVFMHDSCPTGANICDQVCTINIGCIAPVCNFTVT